MKFCISSHNHSRRPGFLGRLMLFAAPVALACALAQTSWSSSYAALGYQVNCALEDDAGVGLQADTVPEYFGTAWLPSRGEFFMVANGQAGTMWNPLGKYWFSPEQLELLRMAYAIGYDDGGEAHAKLVQAVLLQETIAGQLGRLGHLSAPFGKRSYGVMQVKVVAARDVLRHKPQYGSFHTDEQLITRLITDDEFNIRVASAYLKFLRRHMGSDHQALVAYNIGLNKARDVMDAADFKYVQNVERYLAEVVQRYNTQFPDGDAVRVARM